MKIIRFLYTSYTLLVFTILFFLLIPFFIIPILIPSKFTWVGILNRIWAVIFFRLTFFKYELEYHFEPVKSEQYIFCPNHFSYLDIPTMGLNKINTVFVGKNDMEKIPLFGFMYRKLHITVDRNSLKSRYQTLVKSKQAIEDGKNLIIFPEGGIFTKTPPEMTRFKDGAFRTAIEKQIPIVPVTIPHNWIILPDGQWWPSKHLMKIVFHKPLETKGMQIDDLNSLKEQTFTIIDQELKKYLDEDK